MADAHRKTPFGEVCAEARVATQQDEELRAERLWVTGRAEEQIRLTRWKSGRLMPSAAVMSEGQLLAVVDKGIANGVFTPFFLRQLLGVMERHAEVILSGEK